MPLGSAALAGTSYPLDREYTAELLGFDAPCRNSIDAVSDRDFAIEFCAAASICMVHLSRMAEELVLWSSAQFDFIRLPDRYCTGSSIMPQKKEPGRGRTGARQGGTGGGHLMNLLMLMKGQPLSYNKDNQEDKEPLFDTLDTLIGSLRAFADMVPALRGQSRQDVPGARSRATRPRPTSPTTWRKRAWRFAMPTKWSGRRWRLRSTQEKDLSACTLEELQAVRRAHRSRRVRRADPGRFAQRAQHHRRHRARAGAPADRGRKKADRGLTVWRRLFEIPDMRCAHSGMTG